MTRRFFMKLLGGATIAATTLRLVPVSAIPREGVIHDAVALTCHERAIKALQEFHAANPGRGKWNTRGICGNAFFCQLGSDLLGVGLVNPGWTAILIQGVRTKALPSEPPWSIRFEPGFWCDHEC